MTEHEQVADEASGKKGYGPLELDALQEVGNIAAAHASNALSKMVGEDILIDVSESRVFPIEEVPGSLGDMSSEMAAVYMDVKSTDKGIILLLIPPERAIWLSDKFVKREHDPDRGFDEIAELALCEIGNICICTYLNAISSFLDISYFPSPPSVAVDMLGAILDMPASLIGQVSEKVLVIKTKFTHNGNNFTGHILFMPDSESREKIFKRFRI